MSARTKLGLVSLLLVFIVLWFSGLGYRKLANPDEGRYAEIPREMVVSHDWVTPRLNGIKYFEKPPLQYWATATAYTLFGVSEWATRLWPALTGFLTVLVIGWAGARLFGLAAGAAAALILIGNIYFSVMGHIATLDMGLAFFMSLALVCFLRAQAASADMNPLQRDVDPPRRDADQRQRYWMMGAAAASACAVLSKGVVAIALPGLALIFYSLAQRDVSIWRRLHPIASSAVFLAIAAPWFIAVSRANPEFLRFFFIHEHLERYTTATHHREGPLWYFLPILLIGLVPWIGLLPRAVRAAWLAPRPVGTARTQGTFSNERFLVAWALAIFIFFSASHSKLPAYVLPLVPALALLVGREVARMDPRAVFWRIAVVALIAATVLFGAIQAMEYRYASKPDFVLYESYSVWIKAGLATIFIATCVLYRWRATASGRHRRVCVDDPSGFATHGVGIRKALAAAIGLELGVEIRPVSRRGHAGV